MAVLPSGRDLLGNLAALPDTLATYAMLGGSTIFVSELAPIFGGLAANEGALQLRWVVVAVTLGGWLATTALYALGRLKWDWLRRAWPAARSTGTVALRVVKRNPWRASFLVRFLFGARVLLPIACGAARVPVPVYLVMSLLGSMAWTVVFVLVGIAADEAADAVLGHLERVEGVLVALGAAALVGVAAWWWRRRVRKAARKRRQTESH